MPPLDPTLHFHPNEFACHDGTKYPEAWADRWRALSGLCETIRAMWGGPLVVVSGYRTEAYNASLLAEGHHPASQSYHIQGQAADLAPADHSPDVVAALWGMIMRAYAVKQLPTLGGLGVYPRWVHVDTHKAVDDHLRQWNLR